MMPTRSGQNIDSSVQSLRPHFFTAAAEFVASAAGSALEFSDSGTEFIAAAAAIPRPSGCLQCATDGEQRNVVYLPMERMSARRPVHAAEKYFESLAARPERGRSMVCRSGVCLTLSVVVWCGSEPPRLAADLIKLNNGGEIRGQIEGRAGEAGQSQVTIQSLTGARVVVDRDDIRFLTRRPLIYETYEIRARQTPDTVEAQWELAEWCRDNGLKSQRDDHLERILLLDPEHEPAHQGLQHIFRKGRWMTRDEDMQAQGYVRYKGRYITPQELELIEKTQAELDAEREWFKKVKLWQIWLTGRNVDRSKAAYAELKDVTDPDAVPALVRFLGESEESRTRSLCIEILAGLPGTKQIPYLANVCLHDSDYELRYQALNAISPSQYDAAAPHFVNALRSDSNDIVRRAGAALERVGDERTVPHLIAALVTTHKYRVRVPVKPPVSFNTDGTLGNSGQVVLPPEIEAMLRTGNLPHGVIINAPQGGVRTKMVTVNYDHKNAEVLSALRKQTKQDFGYDERTWRLWLLAQKSNPGKMSTIP
jgi:hypothetical protein